MGRPRSSRIHAARLRAVANRTLVPGIALFSILLLLSLPKAQGQATAEPQLAAPFLSDQDAQTFLFSIPAPRGLIVDRFGQPLAQNRVIRRAAIRLDRFGSEKPEECIRAALMTVQLFPYPERLTFVPNRDTLQYHWEHRRSLPFVFSGALTEPQVQHLEQATAFEPALVLQTEYQREYPRKHSACHVVGYVSRDILHPSGPALPQESLWPQVQGTAGLEKAFDQTLRGKDGLVNHLYNDHGRTRREHLLRVPVPGKTLVLTLNLAMQDLAEQILAKTGRESAFVVMEARTGDVLALASHPTFDVSRFVPSISEAEFAALRNQAGNPFFARAHAGVYPPGSIFKPVVALAAMKDGPVKDARFRYRCNPSLNVAGRVFHNWSARDRGYYNLPEALQRSNNVWFYQAALDTGGKPLLAAARAFGLGQPPLLPLDGTAGGLLPNSIVAERALANFSIGQGNLLVSPLQMTLAFCALANGKYLPKPRLLLQVQAPPPSQIILEMTPRLAPSLLPYEPHQFQAVRKGLWEVVNGSSGTGKAARLQHPKVYGKTGTAQWTPMADEDRSVVWFSGFTSTQDPQLVFTVMCEGKPGESISGGKVAAPLAAEFLRTVYADPQLFQLHSHRPLSNETLSSP